MVDAATARDTTSTTTRFTASVAGGDISGATAIALAGDGPEWQSALWKGSLALLHGQFAPCEDEAEHVAAVAVEEGDAGAGRLASILVASLRREQERAAEAEVVLRSQLPQWPDEPVVSALLAAVLADLGRDTEAGRQLERLVEMVIPSEPPHAVPAAVALADVCSVLEEVQYAELLAEWLAPAAGTLAVEAAGAVCLGSVWRALGVLNHCLGRLDEAIGHFQLAENQHRSARAPLLLAHTCRQHSATLRARAAAGDWERGRELLRESLAIYQRLGIDRQAAYSEAVLLRSLDDA